MEGTTVLLCFIFSGLWATTHFRTLAGFSLHAVFQFDRAEGVALTSRDGEQAGEPCSWRPSFLPFSSHFPSCWESEPAGRLPYAGSNPMPLVIRWISGWGRPGISGGLSPSPPGLSWDRGQFSSYSRKSFPPRF